MNQNTFDQENLARPKISITYDRSIGKIGRIITVIGIVILLVCFAFGFIAGRKKKDDLNRYKDIVTIINVLNQYYQNSSDYSDQRHYPTARCSQELNSFDFEYTVRRELIGMSNQGVQRSFVSASSFPRDSRGSYTSSFKNYSGFKCLGALPDLEQAKEGYSDSSPICKFDIRTQKFCYLYTSTPNGDSYKISYYNASLKKFVIFRQSRGGAVIGPSYYKI